MTTDFIMKVNQIKNCRYEKRVALINETKPDIAVSIHQNSYHEESIKERRYFIIHIPKKGNVLQLSCRRH